MSSSAAFEVLVGTVINGLFANGEVDATEIAKFGKFAENIYYNKVDEEKKNARRSKAASQ